MPKAICNKKGGVCTLRTHVESDGGVSLSGPLVTVCPSRFWMKNDVFRWIGERMIGTAKPTIIKEVEFLKSIGGEPSEEESPESAAVGRIDTVLMNPRDAENWCALEIQAVYFSGRKMSSHLGQYASAPTVPVFPDAVRRPDWRSSGPKRLMPQLQTKVPTLRRWGRKMAVLIDRPFFDSLGPMVEVQHLSNCDIVWFVVDYRFDTQEIQRDRVIMTTLESSVDALTAGVPSSKEEFETRLGVAIANAGPSNRTKVIKVR